MSKIAGLNIIAVKVATVRPNPWNPNKMDEETFKKEILSIQNNGFIDPIKVREVDDEDETFFQIVDGEHRWKAAQHLGYAEIPAVNLGRISDEQAKKLTIIANELRGAPEPVLLAALLKDLNQTIPTEALSLELPMSQGEIDSMIKSTLTFDWQSMDAGDATNAAPAGQPHGSSTENVDMRQVRLGQVKGELPAWLHDALLREYDRSAAAVGSRTPEMVFKHWLERLTETTEKSDAQAAALPKPNPPKTRKKKEQAA